MLVHEAFDGGGEGCNRRGDGNARDDCLGAHLDFVDHGFGAVLGGVHDPLDFLVVNEVQEVRAATGDTEHGAGLDAFVVEHRRGAAGRVQFVTEVHELANERDGLLLVFVLERDEDVALARDLVAGSQLALEVGEAAVAENKTRAHQNGVADFLDDVGGFFHVVGDAVLSCTRS
mgnify:CR=1 FL=1